MPTPAPSEAFFSPGTGPLERIVARFNGCRRSVDICVFTVTDDRITRALLAAHRRGVALRLIADDLKAGDLGSDIEQIRAAGVPVRIDRTPYRVRRLTSSMSVFTFEGWQPHMATSGSVA